MSYAPHHPVCDVCGEPKRSTNHWFQARVSASRIVVEPFDARSKAVNHLCGEGCVGKLVSATLAMLHGTLAGKGEPSDASGRTEGMRMILSSTTRFFRARG